MSKKMSAAQKAVLKIQVATAKVINENMVTKYGVGYRLTDIVRKVRELIHEGLMTQKAFLDAIQAWKDNFLVRFNNKYLNPTAKGLTKMAELARKAPEILPPTAVSAPA